MTEKSGEPGTVSLALFAVSSQPGFAAPNAVERSGAKGEVGEFTPTEVRVGLRLRLMLLLVEGALSVTRARLTSVLTCRHTCFFDFFFTKGHI